VASRPKFRHRPRSRPQRFGVGLGLGLKHLASAWPRSAEEEPAICLPTTGHHTIIHVEGSSWATENEKLNCVILNIMIYSANSPVNHHLILFIHNFIFDLGLGLDLKKLASASALTSKPWPWPRTQGPGFGLGHGLDILASFTSLLSSCWNFGFWVIPSRYLTKPPRPTQPGHPSVGRRKEY